MQQRRRYYAWWRRWPWALPFVVGWLLFSGGSLSAAEAPSLSEQVETLRQSALKQKQLTDLLLTRLRQRSDEAQISRTDLLTLSAEAESLKQQNAKLTSDMGDLSRSLAESRAESEQSRTALLETSRLLKESDRKLTEAIASSRQYEQKLENRITLLERHVAVWRGIAVGASIAAVVLGILVAVR